jgi:sulfur-oxidizing protein SoxY
MLRCTVALVAALVCLPAAGEPKSKDPFDSGVWATLLKEHFGGGPVVFDDRVKVTGPKFAEDAMNVPVTVDASALPDVQEVVVLVDRNPIHKVLEFHPVNARPVLSFRFKLQQASPVRAVARTRDGVWRAGGTWVDATGGGCTLPGATRASGTWVQTLNQVQGKVFERGEQSRVRLRVMHPMDTGLVSGIPAFYIDQLSLRDQGGTEFMRIHTYEPVSENPVFSFDLGVKPQGGLMLTGRDNNGNKIQAMVE